MSIRHWLCAASTLAIAATLPPSAQAACPAPGTPNITFTGDAQCTPGGPPPSPPGDDLRAGHIPGQSGAISVTGGAVIQLDSTAPPGANNGPFMVIGRQPGAVGSAVISGAGSAIQLNGNNHGTSAQVGREGTGSITIENGGALRVLDPTAAPGSHTTAGESVFVGRNGGTGTLSLNNGTLTVDSGSGAYIFLGEGAGTGVLTATNGSAITLRDRAATVGGGDAGFVVGRNVTAAPGTSVGTVTITNSALAIQSDSNFSILSVGREAGTIGTMVTTGATVSLQGAAGATGIQVGRDAGSTGTLTFGNSTVSVQSTLGDAFVTAARDGTGSITVQGAATSLQIGAAQFADIIVGRNAGSNGSMVIRDGASVSVAHTNASGLATATVGRLDGSNGNLSVRDNATLDLGGRNAVLQAGREAGSSGSILVDSGATVTLSGTTESTLLLGRFAGATGSLQVASGGQVILSGPLARVLVGAPIEAGGTLLPNATAGMGSLTISGAGSLVSADRIVVGAPVSLAGSTSDGGTVIVSNGGTLQAGEVRIGTSGLVGGSGGTIIGNVVLDGGTLAPGASPGTLNIVGDLTVLDGILKIEIGGTGAGQFDVLNITGTTMIAGGTVLFEFIDGFAPTAGQTFDFFSGPNAPTVAAGVTFAVGGLQAGFQFDLSGPALTFVALTDGISTTVPEPASAALLLAGLLGFAALRRRAA
ncbi:PEP-CTERM sorting domain-containing protein [Elioraea sp.]|uniref:PEP-CTERM sorting domain-containing protein n=1 Tax=Elioraea sp. TaxID=2185103 RepID=UPI003F7013DC